MLAVEVVTLVAVALLGVLVVGLLRSNAELTRALHRLGADLDPAVAGSTAAGVASQVPLSPRPTPTRPDASAVVDLAGVTPAGDAVSLPVSGVRHDTLVAFLTSGCTTCRAFWEVLRSGPVAVPGGARLVVVTRGPEAESPGTLATLAGPSTTVVMSSDTWSGYDVPYAPYFVYVSGSEGRVVGEGAAATWDAMVTLLGDAVADGRSGAAVVDVDRRWAGADASREARIDRELAAAGIFPGDPSLHPPTRLEGPPAP